VLNRKTETVNGEPKIAVLIGFDVAKKTAVSVQVSIVFIDVV